MSRVGNTTSVLGAGRSVEEKGGSTANLSSGMSGNSGQIARRRLSQEEIEERRMKGLCFGCNEPFDRNHKCSKRQVYSMVVESIEEEAGLMGDCAIDIGKPEGNEMYVTLHALQGEVPGGGVQTMQVKGWFKKKSLNILVDSGSTHNFVDLGLVKGMNLLVEAVSQIKVTVADGRSLICRSMLRQFGWEITKTEKYWDWELANETKPICMQNAKEVDKDEYHEFYKKTFSEFLEPLAYTHFTTEGEVEFRSVLFIPGMGPLNNEEVVNPKLKNIRLYVKRVFISDDFDGELFPRYLSFVKGVVDSNDLPLNVSREILQESRVVIRIMRKRLVRKTFDMIQEISESENKEDYKKFWENFGRFLKLGCIEDTGNHKRITPLLRFYTSKSEELTSMDEYVENMGENQKAKYYLATDSLKSAKTAPFLEKPVQKDVEVFYLVEPMDEVAIQNLQMYKEKKFVDISKEDLDLGDEDEVKDRETKQEYNLLCDWVKQQLGEKVAKVQVSKQLSSFPCVLVSGKFGWSANMERLMKAQNLGDTSSLEFMRGQRILEMNTDHPIIKDLNAACKNAPDNDDANRAVDLLYDTALISSGFSPCGVREQNI
ncbi:hypothetical protein MLD38_005520 [Melastoma candidum]|uniref:Uncharacterized protein n=1 Tax=Melastoma candidum TaxID=119954 RepID=A0ACB9RL41_9MYRT|nr:hypothetical protein MLD38_005520 [Melastoma candidum]